MPKFNVPVPPRTPDAVTAQGGEGFTRDARGELFTLGASFLVDAGTFYETAEHRQKRLVDLVHDVTTEDPAWVAEFARWLRNGAQIRSASVIVAAEYAAAGGAKPRRVVDSVIQRGDEPAEMLGYWLSRHGRRLPMGVKRGIADGARRVYTQRSALRYDGAGKPIRFADVIELCHPKPNDAEQSALFRWLLDRRHSRADNPAPILREIVADRVLQEVPRSERRGRLADAVAAGWSWERLAGWLPGGMDAEAWSAVLPNMGAMALVRNLRNFDDAGMTLGVASVHSRLRDRQAIRGSRQFPLGMLNAWKATQSMRWAETLEIALGHTLDNVPRFDGRTLVLVDVSGSMKDPMTARHGRDVDLLARWEVAALFAAALARSAEDAEIVLFAHEPKATARMNSAESVLRFVESCRQHVGGGTNILGALADTYRSHDRVVILTDEQHGYSRSRQQVQWYTGAGRGYAAGYRGGWDDVAHVRCPVYVANLSGDRIGVGPNEKNWLTLAGLSDATFGIIDSFERARRNRWPWQAKPPVEAERERQVVVPPRSTPVTVFDETGPF